MSYKDSQDSQVCYDGADHRCSFKITVLPGDGIGPEVTDEAVKVLKVISKHAGLSLELESKHFGGAAIDATGDPLPEDTLTSCKNADAILLGESD